MKKIDSDLLDELDDTLKNSFDDLLGEEEPQPFSWLKTVGVCVVLVLMVMGGFWLYQSYSDRETMPTSQDVLDSDANDVKKEEPVNINPLKEQGDNDLSSRLEQEKKPVYRSSADTKSSKQDVLNKKGTMDLSSMKLDQHAFYRVVIGPFENYQMAQQQLRQIKISTLRDPICGTPFAS